MQRITNAKHSEEYQTTRMKQQKISLPKQKNYKKFPTKETHIIWALPPCRLGPAPPFMFNYLPWRENPHLPLP